MFEKLINKQSSLYSSRQIIFVIIIAFVFICYSCNQDPDEISSEITMYIQPSPAKGETFKEIEFQLVTEGEIPENSYYQWNFGDTSPIVRRNDKAPVRHTYLLAGTYTVEVELVNDETGLVLKQTWSNAEVELSMYNLAKYYQYITVYFDFSGEITLYDFISEDKKEKRSMQRSLENVPLRGGTIDDCPMVWDDHTFSVYYKYLGKDELQQDLLRTGNINGQLNDDGTFLSLEMHQTDVHTFYDPNNNQPWNSDSYTYIRLKDVPFSFVEIIPPYSIYYGNESSNISGFIQSFTWYSGESGEDIDAEITDVFYDDPNYTPKIYVIFSGSTFPSQ